FSNVIELVEEHEADLTDLELHNAPSPFGIDISYLFHEDKDQVFHESQEGIPQMTNNDANHGKDNVLNELWNEKLTNEHNCKTEAFSFPVKEEDLLDSECKDKK
ncbi:hypothetical protein KI387_015179, partial [Taxus chinensis]